MCDDGKKRLLKALESKKKIAEKKRKCAVDKTLEKIGLIMGQTPVVNGEVCIVLKVAGELSKEQCSEVCNAVDVLAEKKGVAVTIENKFENIHPHIKFLFKFLE